MPPSGHLVAAAVRSTPSRAAATALPLRHRSTTAEAHQPAPLSEDRAGPVHAQRPAPRRAQPASVRGAARLHPAPAPTTTSCEPAASVTTPRYASSATASSASCTAASKSHTIYDETTAWGTLPATSTNRRLTTKLIGRLHAARCNTPKRCWASCVNAAGRVCGFPGGSLRRRQGSCVAVLGITLIHTVSSGCPRALRSARRRVWCTSTRSVAPQISPARSSTSRRDHRPWHIGRPGRRRGRR